MSETRRLFIWNGFAIGCYTSGLAFAIAENEAQARKLIILDLGYDPGEWGHLEIRSLTECVGRGILGG
jgi:hypothetical protein